MLSSEFQRFVASDSWYVRDLQISACSFRTSKPPRTNSSVSQASSSGLEGGLPARMSSIGSIRPTPLR